MISASNRLNHDQVPVGGGQQRHHHDFHAAKDEGADHRPTDVSDAANHGGDERLPTYEDAHVGVD